MKILILGATGATGYQVLNQALEAGHEICVYVRNPKKLENYFGKVEIIQGELSDEKKLGEAVKNKDAVISTLGYKKLWDKSLFISKTIEIVLKAMSQNGVNKLVYESASGIGGNHSVKNPILRTVLRIFRVANPFIDHNRTEKIIKQSNVNWTIIRPGMLTNGHLKAKYRADENLKKVFFISRADTAHCILNSLTNDNWSKKSIDISY
jgi:putative NADH-flavin reductase